MNSSEFMEGLEPLVDMIVKLEKQSEQGLVNAHHLKRAEQLNTAVRLYINSLMYQRPETSFSKEVSPWIMK